MSLRLRAHPFETIFAPKRSVELVTDDSEANGVEHDAQDRREVVVRVPGAAPRVLALVASEPTEATPDDEAPSSTIDVATPPAFGYLYDPPLGSVRYRVAYGGRGKGSSWNFARALLAHGRTKKLRILCAREYQSSIKDSVHKLLSDQIRALTLQGFYEIGASSIVGKNGTEFIFKGLRKDIAQIKSTEGVDICWVEEAESVTAQSWGTLTPTIRKEGSEIWVSFNPALPTDATYAKFVVNPEPNAIIRPVSWKDNPWLPQVLHDEQATLLVRDPEAHAHVWGGQPWSRSDAQVLNGKWRVAEFVALPSWQGPYYGADWGFSHDPTQLVRLWVADSRLWVDYEAGGVQLDNDATAAAFKEMPGVFDVRSGVQREIRADAARPETIHEMRKRKLNVIAARKWKGSVEDGIAHLRTYAEIVIHPRCKRAVQDARLWRYKVDPRTQEVLPVLQDGNDHTWDAARYALSPMIRQRDEPNTNGRPRGGSFVSHGA